MKHYGALLQLISFSCGLTLLTGVAGCKKERDEPVRTCEVQISGMSSDEFERKGITCGPQKDYSFVSEGLAGFETRRYSIDDIRVAAYMDALSDLSEFVDNSVRSVASAKSISTKSELAFSEHIRMKTLLVAPKVDEEGPLKREIEFFNGADSLYRYSYEEPEGGGEVVRLKNKLKLSELMKLLADSKYTVKVISERAILRGHGDVKNDGGIDEIAEFNAAEGGSIDVRVVLKVSGVKQHKTE